MTLDFRHWVFDIGWSSLFFIPVITFSVIGLLSIKVGDKLLIWNKDKSFLRQKENKHKSNWGGRKFHEMIYLLSWKGKNKLENFNRLFEIEYESQRKKDFHSKESAHYYSTIKAWLLNGTVNTFKVGSKVNLLNRFFLFKLTISVHTPSFASLVYFRFTISHFPIEVMANFLHQTTLP